ncbi:hypothetical protein I4U23_008862 [Adineta vaga]|nr:hypothetical protein I4U23_008862 [Adineta vaga]
MGQLFNRISTEQTNPQTTEIIFKNNTNSNKPLITKRKRLVPANYSRKKRFFLYNDYSRILHTSNLTETTVMNYSFSSRMSFKCQLCCQCFSTKDSYLDHMINCAIERHASIRIVRAKTD